MQEVFNIGNAVVTVIPPLEQRWWTTRDVAEYRGVSAVTVRRWVREAKQNGGGIPFSQPQGSRHIRFGPEAVRAYFGDNN